MKLNELNLNKIISVHKIAILTPRLNKLQADGFGILKQGEFLPASLDKMNSWTILSVPFFTEKVKSYKETTMYSWVYLKNGELYSLDEVKAAFK